MKDKIYNKINDKNKKIVEELLDNLFKIDGKYMNKDEKINYCINLINNSSYLSEDLDFLEVRDLADMRYKLNDDNCSDIEKEILIIKIFSLVDYNMMLPYTAYELILDDKI